MNNHLHKIQSKPLAKRPEQRSASLPFVDNTKAFTTMVVSKSVVSDYDLMKPDGSGAKLRYGSCSNNMNTKSPGVGISRRSWSPGQAVLFKRKKVEGEATLSDSLDALALSDLHDHIDYDDEEEDYLTKTLMSNNTRGAKRSGRRPTKSTSMMGRMTTTTNTAGYNRSRPMKSRSMGSPRDFPPSSAMHKPSNKIRYTPERSYSNSNSDSNNGSGGTSTPDTTSKSSRSKSHSKPRLQSRGRVSRSKSPAAHNYKKNRSKSGSRSGPKTDQRSIPIEVQKKLYRITDPNITIKQRVELELEFMRGTPEEKRLYLEFRNHFDRNEFLNWKAMGEQQKREEIEAKAREESLKEAAFRKTVERKRQMERRHEEEARERERRTEEQARLHSAKTIANAMAEIKDSALEAATVSVTRNQNEKKRYEDEFKQRVEHFRRTEGKDMTGAQRALKEALIEQEDPEEKRIRLGHSRRR